MSKAIALIIGLSLIVIFGGLAFAFPDNSGHLGTVLTAVVTLVSAYIGLQVVNNGVRGKFFNSDLYEVENKGGEK